MLHESLEQLIEQGSKIKRLEGSSKLLQLLASESAEAAKEEREQMAAARQTLLLTILEQRQLNLISNSSCGDLYTSLTTRGWKWDDGNTKIPSNQNSANS